MGVAERREKKMDRQNLAKPCQVRSTMLDPPIRQQADPCAAVPTPAGAEVSGSGV